MKNIDREITRKIIQLPLFVNGAEPLQIEVSLSRISFFAEHYHFFILPGQTLPGWFAIEGFVINVRFDEEAEKEMIDINYFRPRLINQQVLDFMKAGIKCTDEFWGQEIEPKFTVLDIEFDQNPYAPEKEGYSLLEKLIFKTSDALEKIDTDFEAEDLIEPDQLIADLPLEDSHDEGKIWAVLVLITKVADEGTTQFHCEIMVDQDSLPAWFVLDHFNIEVAKHERTGVPKVSFTVFKEILSRRKEIGEFMKKCYLLTDFDAFESAFSEDDRTQYIFKQNFELQRMLGI